MYVYSKKILMFFVFLLLFSAPSNAGRAVPAVAIHRCARVQLLRGMAAAEDGVIVSVGQVAVLFPRHDVAA